jgi:hypothetical protein
VVSHKCATPQSAGRAPASAKEKKGNGTLPVGGAPGSSLVSSYFIGLSFVSGLVSANLSSEINVNVTVAEICGIITEFFCRIL